MTKLEEKTLDLLFEKHTKTREVARDEYETAIYNVKEFRKELMEVLGLIYPDKTDLTPKLTTNLLFKGNNELYD